MAYFGGTTNELACGLHRTHRGKLIAAVIVGKMGRLNLTGKPSGSCVARKAFTLSGRDNTKGIARVCGRRISVSDFACRDWLQVHLQV